MHKKGFPLVTGALFLKLAGVLAVVLYITPLIACWVTELVAVGGGEVVQNGGTSGAWGLGC